MARTGPKIRTAANSGVGTAGFIRDRKIEPTSALSEAAMVEFRRLIEVLRQRGTLDRVDLTYPTEAARLKTLIDAAHKDAALQLDVKAVRLIAMLGSQHRGHLRDMGLPVHASRSLIHGDGAPKSTPGKWDGLLKLKPGS